MFYIATKNQNGGHLEHSGTKGLKWGVRHYQNYDGTYTPEGLERYWPGSKHGRRGSEKVYATSVDKARHYGDDHGYTSDGKVTSSGFKYMEATAKKLFDERPEWESNERYEQNRGKRLAKFGIPNDGSDFEIDESLTLNRVSFASREKDPSKGYLGYKFVSVTERDTETYMDAYKAGELGQGDTGEAPELFRYKPAGTMRIAGENTVFDMLMKRFGDVTVGELCSLGHKTGSPPISPYNNNKNTFMNSDDTVDAFVESIENTTVRDLCMNRSVINDLSGFRGLAAPEFDDTTQYAVDVGRVCNDLLTCGAFHQFLYKSVVSDVKASGYDGCVDLADYFSGLADMPIIIFDSATSLQRGG